MITRRVHIIDGIPISSNELNSYYYWLDQILNNLSDFYENKTEADSIEYPYIITY